ncbi:para-nitrobenzyl esterase [Stackebrandtia endophytica]|uniref:Para-nitrobenzyl esterase n=1 Tax=Stackebrandtia endophytica TaxID=1496996 RepID=A0A543B3T1_9ACTN|nr:carboxylesterase family protein [Stackebrandtia endophytica]TQL79491.1 para-nitrobenzyl esterase [Stackebrandtia endophytica]
MSRKLAMAAVLTLAVAASCGTASSEENTMTADVVTIDTGQVRGTVADDHRLFQGIPYAASTAGENRWLPPQPAASWEGVRDATRPGSPCPQVGGEYGGDDSFDEDCLFLNVTTPPESTGDKPVVIWIHGNGSIGSGDVFSADRMAAQGDVIVVTVNYRMGVFGAFAHPELADSGTLGLQDQRAAMQWVQRNAAAFGGDPDNVTLFGVSFGATAISGHLIATESQGLFQRAIMHSGFSVMDAPDGALYEDLGAMDTFGWTVDAEQRAMGEAIAAELGCVGDSDTVLECLRAKTAEELLSYPAIMNIFQSYSHGSAELPQPPADALAAGDFAEVPVLAGSTLDEHRTFVAIRILTGAPIEDDRYDAVLAQAFGDDAAVVAQQYPLADYANANEAFAQVMTDRMWAQAIMRQNELLAAKNPVYFYEFADRNPPAEFPFPPQLEPGAYHNADISYLLRAPEFEAELSPEQLELSDAMIGYWSRFAWTGDPNGDGAVEWPMFGDSGYVQSLAPGEGGIGQVDFRSEHLLDFWESLG